MSDNVTASLLTLPAELIYRILDNVDILTIEVSFQNVCTRLKAVTDTYRQYPVNFDFIMNSVFLFGVPNRQCLTNIFSSSNTIVRKFFILNSALLLVHH